ncbi:MAG: glycosyltransferase family 4 protein [Bacteroidales bacterium]|nr:glycosyltransferase family 4 protein [Bacteroidales bacterium]
MRIGVNTRLLLDGKMDGIGWFAFHTLRRMVAAHPEHEFFFFFDRKPSPKFIFADNVKPVVVNPPARHPVLWWLFFECGIARAIKKHRIDLFLSPDGYIPLHAAIPVVDVIHDINFAHFPNNLKPSHQRYMSHYFPLFADKASQVVTVSEFSKADIAKTYTISPDKISVVYNGAGDAYRPLSPDEQLSVRQQYCGGSPYFIFVSTILRRKNLANLLKAFDLFKSSDSQGHKLLVVGARVWWQDELKEAFDSMKHQSDVQFLGHTSADELSRLLAASTALVYPSFFEGFGIPIVEAFCAETAVITSNVTSMPEVAGDAALLIDPHNVNAIADAMHQLADDTQLRQQLIERGRARRSLFTWDDAATKLWDIMMQTYKDA